MWTFCSRSSFAGADKHKGFQLALHVTPFCDAFDPNWEFRGFVCKGRRTGLTAYSPWVWEPRQADPSEKAAILARIEQVWDQAEAGLRSQNYSIDFAVSPSTGECWVVEVNNFLPPLSGSGLFSMDDPYDVELLRSGPFEFRVRTAPPTAADLERQIHNADGTTTRILMQPAPPALMQLLAELRRKQAEERVGAGDGREALAEGGEGEERGRADEAI